MLARRLSTFTHWSHPSFSAHRLKSPDRRHNPRSPVMAYVPATARTVWTTVAVISRELLGVAVRSEVTVLTQVPSDVIETLASCPLPQECALILCRSMGRGAQGSVHLYLSPLGAEQPRRQEKLPSCHRPCAPDTFGWTSCPRYAPGR